MHVPDSLVHKSNFFMNMNDCCEPGMVPLATIKKDTMDKVIYYNDNPDIQMNETQETMFDIVMAADFLQIDDLLDRGCRTIADIFRGKSPKEIRSILGISEYDLI